MEKTKSKRRSKLQWRELIEAQPQSSMNISDYCKHHKITTASFFTWRKKLFDTSTGDIHCSNQPDNDWIPLTLKSDVATWDIELCLPGGVTLKMKKS